MENLSEEKITNLIPENSGDKMIKKDNFLKKESNDEKNTFSSKEEKIKKSHFPQYSNLKLLIKILKISLLNWKYLLFDRAQSIVIDTLEMYLPMQKGIIIDCITDKSKHNLLYPNFVKIVKFIIIKLIFEVIIQLIKILYINDTLDNYKCIVLENISEKDIEFFDLYKSGELIERIKKNELLLECNMLSKLLEDLQRLFMLFYLAYYLLNTNIKLSIISIIIMLGKSLGQYISNIISGEFDFSKFNKLDDKYNIYLTDFISNIRLVKSFGNERYELNRIKEVKRKIYKLLSNPYLVLSDIIYGLSKIGDYFILFYTGNLVISGKFSFGQYTVFDKYFSNFQDEFDVLYKSLLDYKKNFSVWRNFFELYDYKPKIFSQKNYIPEKINGKIDFENVKFSYPLSPDVKILENLTFSIEPGKILALVGHSGSGKSTIANLLQRFYDPIEGEIFIDNINIKDFNLEWLHQNLGFVSQEPVLCNESIEYNITYGVKEYTKNKLEEVCELSNVNKFIKDKRLFPDGLNTLVGEKGSKVSGGQKQRIAIARAIMKDVKILIFDEATSALDAESESEVQSALDNIIKSKKITTIIIAHRLSTIKNADKILFLNKGQIIESGTHEELLELNGEYKKLIAKQL